MLRGLAGALLEVSFARCDFRDLGPVEGTFRRGDLLWQRDPEPPDWRRCGAGVSRNAIKTAAWRPPHHHRPGLWQGACWATRDDNASTEVRHAKFWCGCMIGMPQTARCTQSTFSYSPRDHQVEKSTSTALAIEPSVERLWTWRPSTPGSLKFAGTRATTSGSISLSWQHYVRSTNLGTIH